MINHVRLEIFKYFKTVLRPPEKVQINVNAYNAYTILLGETF